METTPKITDHINNLKDSLIQLHPTGANGFEGLMGVALGEIVGIPFRLASGGSQSGVDGRSVYSNASICFETKLYNGPVGSAEVMAKIGELAIGKVDTELWILCATSQISSQIADKVSTFAKTSAVSTLILDWATDTLPPLAVALAMASEKVCNFLRDHIGETNSGAVAALTAIKTDSAFERHAEELRTLLNEPTLGMDAARMANAKWLTDAFSSRQKATEHFGQPLSPLDPANGEPYVRDNLAGKLRPFLTGELSGQLLCVIGDEGSGKSWLVVQSWLSVESKPLMVVMTPNVFSVAVEQNDVQELLISTLIEQTGDHERDSIKEKWRRILERWRNHPAGQVRLVVLIDGLNQRREKDWARITDRFYTELGNLCGQLIITARSPYYRDRIQRRSTFAHNCLEVPEWTATERDEILTSHKIKTENLAPSVAVSLRNPRLLGIALGLLTNDEIVGLEELSVGRLFFEHIRLSERDAPEPQPVHDFVRRLRTHAEEIISRISDVPRDDLIVFDNDNYQAVVDGRFFHPVEGDATRYTLAEHGLTLALGFAVIDRLHGALRNRHDLDQVLEQLIEPIAAVDMTASVFVSALMTTCIDGTCSDDITTPLLRAIANLQNPSEDELNQLGHLARIRPILFTEAAYRLCISGGSRPNLDRIVEPLIYASWDQTAWKSIFEKLRTWLSCYSLSPERGLFPASNQAGQDQRDRQRDVNRKKIADNLVALSRTENKILGGLSATDGDVNMLARVAFTLLAGKPIEPAAQVLAHWIFANALVSDHMIPYRDFFHLVRLNRIDWRDTRSALLREADVLRHEDVSTPGKWALVKILLATGNTEDARAAKILLEELTKHHQPSPGWRLIESYCTTDPCDPTTERPDNLDKTTREYEAIDVAQVRPAAGNKSTDLVFRVARPGMARFEIKTAAAKHRDFARDVVRRKGLPLYQGLHELRDHNPLLLKDHARDLLDVLSHEITSDDDYTDEDRQLTSQFGLLLAFPFLSGQEQLDALRPADLRKILLDLLDVLKPLEETVFDRILDSAYVNGDEQLQFVVLLLANQTPTRVSWRSRKRIAELLKTTSDRVRAEAMGVIARLGDRDLLAKVVYGGWRASKDIREDEALDGSDILVQAAACGLIEHGAALDRMSPNNYGRAAEAWARKELSEAVRDVALRMDTSIRCVVELNTEIRGPDIGLDIGSDNQRGPTVDFLDHPSDSTDQFAALALLAESNRERQERQKRNLDAFKTFKCKLKDQKSFIILGDLGLDGFRTIAEADERLVDKWYEVFVNLAEDKLPAIHNLVLLLAHALGWRFPTKAAELFLKTRDKEPLVRIRYGYAKVPLEAMSLWSGPDAEALNRLRLQQLDRAVNDYELSQGVLAAHMSGKQNLLRRYIDTKQKTEEPAEIARAIMVSGFSDDDPFNDKVLNNYRNADGFIGDAHKAACYAYDRNKWAKHWFTQMCKTEKAEEFWGCSVLFLKIVDGRYDIWRSEYADLKEPMLLFRSSIRSSLRSRIGKWQNKRKRKLFGDDIPRRVFSYAIKTDPAVQL